MGLKFLFRLGNYWNFFGREGRTKQNQTANAMSERPTIADPTPMPAFAPVLRPDEDPLLSAQGRPRAKTWLMMTETTAVVVAGIALTATAELMDANAD